MVKDGMLGWLSFSAHLASVLFCMDTMVVRGICESICQSVCCLFFLLATDVLRVQSQIVGREYGTASHYLDRDPIDLNHPEFGVTDRRNRWRNSSLWGYV